MKKKKRKLKLEDLKTESFVTNIDDANADTVKGGGPETTIVPLISVSIALSVAASIAYSINNCPRPGGNAAVGGNANTQCCSYLNPDQCGGAGNTFNPGCV